MKHISRVSVAKAQIPGIPTACTQPPTGQTEIDLQACAKAVLDLIKMQGGNTGG